MFSSGNSETAGIIKALQGSKGTSMAYNDQILSAWAEWEVHTGSAANNPDDFISWAIANQKWTPRPIDVRQAMRRDLRRALRQQMKVDENGVTYRAKQCVISIENKQQIPLWFDVDTGGTPSLRRKAVKQRRDAIANDVYRAACDVEHMNYAHQSDDPIQFVMDFSEDCAERRAAERLREEDDDAA